MAGVAANEYQTKQRCIHGLRSFEGGGIVQNTYRTRQLLTVVVEEGREGEWVEVARERGMGVLSCGL